ncbi:MAG: RNA polymerase sigma factor [Candidatus Eremiobacteraeota bacterium]|nr:RNA polymerase sigma factor [Candidatus Eremiobacteraeota bacterium]MBV8498485.1 RNA polymerase sigma factor [Candidatus Eremiobacteraeota bacterium]
MTSHGAHDAFLASLDRHRGILFKVANAYCRDPASREDLVQEIVLQLWRAYPRFDGRAKFSTWMYRIAVNVAISFYRSERRTAERIEHSDGAQIEELAAPGAQPDDNAAFLYEIIDRFDALSRALMILYLDDRPYSEIAEILGITQTNVATKISRLKEQLRRGVAAHAVR